MLFWNIRAGGGPSRAQAIALDILERKPDIVCLCECRPTFIGQIAAVIRNAGLIHTFATTDQPRHNGILLASRFPAEPRSLAQGRIVDADVCLVEADRSFGTLRLTAVHVPDASKPNPRRDAFADLRAVAKQSRDLPHLMLGDFNADRARTPARDGLPMGRLASLGYADLPSRSGPGATDPTWLGPRGETARLDHALASESLVSRVISAGIDPRPMHLGLSDHAILSIEISLKDP